MPYRRELNVNTATPSELVIEILRLRADLALLCADLFMQANDREWCGDYDKWVRHTNRRLSRPHLVEREDLWVDEPVYHDPATGAAHDPTLDESGRFLVNPCPAGGDHRWTNEVSEAQRYIPPNARWHCMECGIRRPAEPTS